MEPSFWLDRWQNANIKGFHLPAPNPALVQHWPALKLPKNARVLVPLCGKTLDMPWLASQGHQVIGAELSELAVEQFFQELGVTPTVSQQGKLKCHKAGNITLYQGDVFDLTPAILGPIDAIYDRAALVALPPEMRVRYTAHLLALGGPPQLLVTYTYDTSIAQGPPFSIPEEEVHRHYDARYKVSLLSALPVGGGGLRGQLPATEWIWLLERR